MAEYQAVVIEVEASRHLESNGGRSMHRNTVVGGRLRSTTACGLVAVYGKSDGFWLGVMIGNWRGRRKEQTQVVVRATHGRRWRMESCSRAYFGGCQQLIRQLLDCDDGWNLKGLLRGPKPRWWVVEIPMDSCRFVVVVPRSRYFVRLFSGHFPTARKKASCLPILGDFNSGHRKLNC